MILFSDQPHSIGNIRKDQQPYRQRQLSDTHPSNSKIRIIYKFGVAFVNPRILGIADSTMLASSGNDLTNSFRRAFFSEHIRLQFRRSNLTRNQPHNLRHNLERCCAPCDTDAFYYTSALLYVNQKILWLKRHSKDPSPA